MNTKGIKFLAVLAVLAMAFAAFAVIAPTQDADADDVPSVTWAEAIASTEYFVVSSGTYTLQQDLIVTTQIVDDGTNNLTLDLNGHSLTVKNTTNQGINTSAHSKTVTITSTDSTKSASMTINAVGVGILAGGTVVVDGFSSTYKVSLTINVDKDSANKAYGIKAVDNVSFSEATVTINAGGTSEGVSVEDSIGILADSDATGAADKNVTVGEKTTLNVYSDTGIVAFNLYVNGGSTLKVKALLYGVDVYRAFDVINTSSTSKATIDIALFSGYSGEAVPVAVHMAQMYRFLDDSSTAYYTITIQGYYGESDLQDLSNQNITKFTIPKVSANGTFQVTGTSGKINVTFESNVFTVEYDNYVGGQILAATWGTTIGHVIVTGESTVTASEEYAFLNRVAGDIKSIDGTGKLHFIGDDMRAGIVFVGGADIKALDELTFELTGENTAIALDGTSAGNNTLSIYATDVTISVNEDVEAGVYGIYWNGLTSLRSSAIAIDSGYAGIYGTGANAKLNVEVTVLTIDGGQYGIRTTEMNVLSNSVVTASCGAIDSWNGNYGTYIVGILNVQSDATLTTEGLYLAASDAVITNNATINLTGDVVILGTLENKAIVNNTATVAVYGKIVQSAGDFNNLEGGSVIAYKYAGPAADTTVVYQATPSANNTAGVFAPRNVVIKQIVPMADGSFGVTAWVNFENTDDQSIEATIPGKITLDSSGNIASADLYYTSTDGTTTYDLTLTVTLTYNSTSGAPETYELESSGELYTQIGGSGAAAPRSVDADSTKTGMVPATGSASASLGLQITGGTFANAGTVSIAVADEILNKGTLDNTGKLVFSNAVTMKDGTLNNQGTMSVASFTMSKGTLKGEDITVTTPTTSNTITLSGSVDIGFSYEGTYTYTDTDGTKVTATYDDLVNVYGNPSGLVISMPKATKDNKGFANISVITAASGKKLLVSVAEGGAVATGVVSTGANIEVLSGATLQIAKAGVTATAGVVSVQDGATLLTYIKGDPVAKNYGDITYDIMFAANGYTYYGSIGFALENADGTEPLYLKDKQATTISTTTTVKDGIVLYFGEGSTLTITNTPDADKTVFTMGEGAKMVLNKKASITINNDVTVSGTFEYDENVIGLEKMVADGDSVVITPVLETSKDVSKIKIEGTYDNGLVTVLDGVSTGTVTLDKETELNASNEKVLKNTGNFAIAEDALSENTVLTTNNRWAVIAIEGALSIPASTTYGVYGNIIGLGDIVLADGSKVQFYDNASATIEIVNTGLTDAFALAAVSFLQPDANGKVTYIDYDTTAATVKATVTSVAKVGTAAAYMKAEGDIKTGVLSADGNTMLDAFTISKDAVAINPDDAVMTIGKNEATATGLLMNAGTLYMRITDDSSTVNYGVLNYQITFVDDDYTVYSSLAAGVAMAEAGDNFYVDKILNIDSKMVIPTGVTITVAAEDAYINLIDGGYIIVGTPSTSLGDISGVIGPVVLSGEYTFVVVYSDESVDMMSIYQDPALTTEAVSSQYLINNGNYATVYAKDGKLNMSATTEDLAGNAAKALRAAVKPSITGYIVGPWVFVKFDDSATANVVGDGNFTAIATPLEYKVTFVAVEGLQYYVDNMPINAPNVTLDVAYGAQVTAKALSGYTGTPVVNGKSVLIITEDLKVTGSGVQPIPEPEPTPVPEKESEWNITTILLCILVVLIAIMAVIVALRLNRS